MIQYKVIKAYEPEDLESKINKMALDGFKINSSPFVYDAGLLVLMYRD
ncbi:hypothetical protein SAMN04489722_108202 [Algibacter lectus]|nr:hypothetical protein [Algibacter lectus]SFD38641.1 hypothetical protein SAMN04489722_108202 [Algibacter lectus]